nr:condensation domain-containing protein [Micromonospora tarapacensis]
MQQGDTGRSLSLGQERSWFIDQYVDAPVDVLVERVELRGPLRADTLGVALGDIVAAAGVLRWAIGTEQGRACQRPAAPMPAALPGTDLSALPAAERREAVRRAVGRAAATRFDLGRGPLLRAELLRLAADEHLLLLTAHRAVVDPTSLSLLVARLGAAYRARLADPAAPGGTADGNDFVAFAERERTEAEAARAVAGAAWREHLADVAPLELPTDRVRGVQPRYEAGAADVLLPTVLHEQLSGLAARLGVRPGDVLRAGFQALLHRWSGQPVLAVGSARTGGAAHRRPGRAGGHLAGAAVRDRRQHAVRRAVPAGRHPGAAAVRNPGRGGPSAPRPGPQPGLPGRVHGPGAHRAGRLVRCGRGGGADRGAGRGHAA